MTWNKANATDRNGMKLNRFALDREMHGMQWIGLDWIGTDWIGLDWKGMIVLYSRDNIRARFGLNANRSIDLRLCDGRAECQGAERQPAGPRRD
eukprot:scaffold454032_cov40-Prasinocladus_malaysianus.AAC.1